ncbi:MAG: hypothetical protein CMC22_01885 [Flavobacteriaceae bacterium]|nr:hypothetical protein [Flavobacteriaceae bacterium]|tara:strand:- start:1524 stop:2411 length:888 start_codon:yes stop_codon:yes gene_type:complete
MKPWHTFIDNIFLKVFSEKNQKRVERATLWLSMIGFIIHLFLIYAKKYDWFKVFFESSLLIDPISAIYTPFSIILVYEIYLLVVNLPRSFTTSVSKQFEIISLILIRRIFADIPKIDLKANWLSTQENVQLIYDVLGVLIIFFLIYLFNKGRSRLPKKPLNPNLQSFVASKKAVSMILLPILIITSLVSVYNWIYGLFYLQITTDINAIFYNEFFTILILADVLILLLSFQYTERYSQLIRNTGFVICTILIRLSFGVSGLTNVLLVISSVAFGLLILTIYNLEENPVGKNVNTN